MNIVILAFGPSKTTTAAVKRARKLAGASVAIDVVAATELGRPHHLPGATVAEGIGSTGLRSVLSTKTGPTLLIHDDAALGPRALGILTGELERHRCVIVPGTNDVGSDHFVGVLPPVEQAEARLAQVTCSSAGTELRTIIPTVLFGEADSLDDLIESRIVDPRTTLTATTMRFVASKSVATHNGVCRSRLVTPGADGRPLLVASMIVKDEEETLEDCLVSLRGLVDRVDIVDTGSTDGTVDLARRLGANVSHVEWRDDFAWARNQALELSRDAHFVLQVDADERIVCAAPGEFRSFLATFGSEYKGFQPRIYNYGDVHRTTVSSEFRATRLFTTDDTEFVGAIHEAPVLISAGGVSVPASPLDMFAIDHIGYSREFVGARDKAARNIRIAEADAEVEEGFRTLFHLARSLQLVDGNDPTIPDLFERALTYEEQANPQSRAHAYGSLAQYRLQQGEVQAALELAELGAALVPADELCAVAACEALARLGRNREILSVIERLRVGGPIAPLFTTERLQRALAGHEVAALALTGRFEDAYVKALAILRTAPESFTQWAALVSGARTASADAAEVLSMAAVLDPTGSFDRVVATKLEPAIAARFAVRYFAHGGRYPSVAATGILTAIVADDLESALALTGPARHLEPAVIRKLATMADDRGFPEVAEALAEMAVA